MQLCCGIGEGTEFSEEMEAKFSECPQENMGGKI
jgi:hypothetical protein